MKTPLAIASPLLVLAMAAVASGQSPQSPNTLKLDKQENRPTARITDIAWLQGRWVGAGLGGTTEEVWAPPLGDSMLGMYRLVKNGKVMFCELCTIVEDGDSLVLKLKHFDSKLKGWEEKDVTVNFPLVKLTGSEAYFDGLTFRKTPEGDLLAYVVTRDKKTKAEREAEFRYHPAHPEPAGK